jgi:hypothetical protein
MSIRLPCCTYIVSQKALILRSSNYGHKSFMTRFSAPTTGRIGSRPNGGEAHYRAFVLVVSLFYYIHSQSATAASWRGGEPTDYSTGSTSNPDPSRANCPPGTADSEFPVPVPMRYPVPGKSTKRLTKIMYCSQGVTRTVHDSQHGQVPTVIPGMIPATGDQASLFSGNWLKLPDLTMVD